MATRVKICGITNLNDALTAIGAGADALGFVFYEKSPRYVDGETAALIIKKLPPFVSTVGVFVDERLSYVNTIVKRTGINVVQFHGDETREQCTAAEAKVIKAFRIKGGEDMKSLTAGYESVAAFLLDTYAEGAYGGTGESFDWDAAIRAKEFGRIILSGGLTPENVADAIKKVRPFAVDVSSGVELSPGKKDAAKVKTFIENVRSVKDEA